MNEFLNCCLWLDNGYDDAVNKVFELSSVFMMLNNTIEENSWRSCGLISIENRVAFVRLTLQIYINYEHKSIIFFLSTWACKLRNFILYLSDIIDTLLLLLGFIVDLCLMHFYVCVFFLLFKACYFYVIFSERNHKKAKNGFCSSFWFHFDDDGQEKKKWRNSLNADKKWHFLCWSRFFNSFSLSLFHSVFIIILIAWVKRNSTCRVNIKGVIWTRPSHF